MKVLVDDLAKENIKDIYDYNLKFSLKNAIETNKGIRLYIHYLENMPYIGRYILEIPNHNYRELIYKKRRTSYRIIYFISEKANTIYILYVLNSKQDFKTILKRHHYLKNFLKF